jgi:DNA-binding transcriptional LysR family regulator
MARPGPFTNDRRRRTGSAARRLHTGTNPPDGSELLALHVATVLEVSARGSFSAAARALQISQTTVSRRVQDLEDRIGISIFERYADGVRLTAAGQSFASRLSQSRDLLATAVREARLAGVADVGALNVGFVWSFAAGIAAEILARFRTSHEDIRMRLTELGAAELLEQTLRRELDCAWIVRWHKLEPTLRIEPLWTERLCIVTPDHQPMPETADWNELAGKPYLCRATDEWRRFQSRFDLLGGVNLELQVHDCSLETILTLVAGGEGVTLLPESIARRGFPGVRFTPMSDPRAALEICCIYRRETDNPALRRFLAITRDVLRGAALSRPPRCSDA